MRVSITQTVVAAGKFMFTEDVLDEDTPYTCIEEVALLKLTFGTTGEPGVAALPEA